MMYYLYFTSSGTKECRDEIISQGITAIKCKDRACTKQAGPRDLLFGPL